jgi:uncharacterized membrane protein YdjX (TVP38/TMEM64 family)
MSRARAAVAGIVLVAIVVAIARSGIFDDLSVDGLRARIESYGSLGPLVFIGLMVAGFFVPGPELLLVGLGGAIFGTIEGFLYGWIAAVAGTALPFLLVRQAVGGYVLRPDGVRFRRLRAIDERLAVRGFATVLVLRLLLCMSPPLNWALGATRVRLRDYVLGTAVGVTPGIGLGAYLGDAVTDAASWRALLTPEVVLPALLAVAFTAASVVAGRRLFGGPAGSAPA